MTLYGIDDLPEELQLHIFGFLDFLPPSQLNARQEPSLDLTASEQHALKDISRVSKRWRRIVLSLLFKHARLRLDNSPRPEWAACNVCGDQPHGIPKPSPRELPHCQPYHAEMMKLIHRRVSSLDQNKRAIKPGLAVFMSGESHESPNEMATVAWALRFYHVLEDFLKFVQSAKLCSIIRSFTLLSDRMLSVTTGRFPHQSGAREWRYPAAAAFWQHLLSYIDPERIVILAPPTELACLTNGAIDTIGVSLLYRKIQYTSFILTNNWIQEWAFKDMEFQLLALKRDSDHVSRTSSPIHYGDLQPIPMRHPSFARSSVLYLRPWTHVGLNEGSFLKAYGTYEYFERGPPSLVYSIKRCLLPEAHLTHLNTLSHPPRGLRSLSALRSFTYTGIFPFSNHANFAEMLPYLEELDVSYAPDPQSGILDDKERTGKAELMDCWQELISAYHDLATTICTIRMSETSFPRLKKFICRDKRIPALQDELDEVFTPLCLPVWAEIEPGEFTRLATSPRLPESNDLSSVLDL